MGDQTLLSLGVLTLLLVLALLLWRAFATFTSRNEDVSSFVNDLLEHLVKTLPLATVTDVSCDTPGPSMRRMEFASLGCTYVYLCPRNWEAEEDDAPRPLRMLEGTITRSGTSQEMARLFSDSIWGEGAATSIGFMVGEDPLADPEVRDRHGMLYDLTARGRRGEVIRHVHGALEERHTSSFALHELFAKITHEVDAHLARQIDSEGGAL